MPFLSLSRHTEVRHYFTVAFYQVLSYFAREFQQLLHNCNIARNITLTLLQKIPGSRFQAAGYGIRDCIAYHSLLFRVLFCRLHRPASRHTGIAARISSTECWRMNTVETLMSTAAPQNASLHPGVLTPFVFQAVQATAAEPTTWRDGQTLVWVSNV